MSPALKILFLTLLSFTGLAAASARGNPTEDVMAAERNRREALLRGDTAALGTLLSEELRYIHSNGRVESKRDILTGFESKHVAYGRFDLSGLEARTIAEDVVVLTGKIHQRKRSGDLRADAHLLFHAVWRNEAGTWRLVSLQTAVPPAPNPKS